MPNSVPANELDYAVIQSLSTLAQADQRGILLAKAETAAHKMRTEMELTRERRGKELKETRRKRLKLERVVVDQAATATARILDMWDKELAELELKEQTLIGQAQACDDVIARLEQAALEAEATLEQVNLIQEFWESEDWVNLHAVIDLLVDSVNVRATDKQYDVRVRLYPLSIVREIFETIPNVSEVEYKGVGPSYG